MAYDRIDHFNRWAQTYEQHPFQRELFAPVHESALRIAAQMVARPTAILDVGCGTGHLLRCAAARFPGADLVGVDASIEMVREARASLPPGVAIRFQCAMAEALPLEADAFDLAFSTLTFCHWSDQRAGIAEVDRVLAGGGRWLLADFFPGEKSRYLRRPLRSLEYEQRERLQRMLADAGLEIEAGARIEVLGGCVPIWVIEAKASTPM